MLRIKVIKNNVPGVLALVADFAIFTLLLLPIPLFVLELGVQKLVFTNINIPHVIIVPLLLIVLFSIVGSYKSPIADLGHLSIKRPLAIIWILALVTIVMYVNRVTWSANTNYFLLKIIIVASIYTAFVIINRISIQIFVSFLLRVKIIRHQVVFAFHHKPDTPYLKEFFRRIKSNNQTLVGYCSNKKSDNEILENVQHLGTFKETVDICNSNNIDELIIFNYKGAKRDVENILAETNTKNILVRITPSESEPFVTENSVTIDRSMAISIKPKRTSIIYIVIKRMLDIVSAILGLIFTMVLYPFFAYKIKKDSEGPIIYRQKRMNQKGKEFKLYKFRTMYVDAEKDGPKLASKTDDPRITPFGHFLRNAHIDELPQFWNLLKGDLSLVGIRPERQFYTDKLLKTAPYYKLVSKIKPGITSLGMVKYGYAHNLEEMQERMMYDIIYLNNRSLIFDFQIIGYTIAYILNKIFFWKK